MHTDRCEIKKKEGKVIKKCLVLSFMLLSFNAFSIEVSEETAIAKIEEFFYLLDVDRYDKEEFSKVVTEDFQIFEDGLNLDLDSFHEFVTEATVSLAVFGPKTGSTK